MKISLMLPLALTITALALTLTASACSIVSNSEVTFYGYPDNDPPGSSIAYRCGRGNAGGTGTYADPLTFASALGEYNQCEIIYLPYLKKYLRHEDLCQQCTDDWNNGRIKHIDVWTGSSSSNGHQAQINCENALTPGNQGIVRQPSPNLSVNTAALFQNGKCNTGATNPNNNPGAFCGGGGSPPSGGGSPPSGGCSWAGHCAGASCGNDNDCSGALTCQNGHCA